MIKNKKESIYNRRR